MNARWYQWLFGKHKDEVEEVREIVDQNNEEYVVFKSGNKIKKNDMANEMKPVGAIDDIEGNIRFNSAKYMDGILKEDLEKYSKGDSGAYSLGTAHPAGLLSEEDAARLIAQAQKQQARQAQNDLLAGIPSEDEVVSRRPEAPAPQKNIPQNAPKQMQKAEKSSGKSEIDIMLANAKKEEVAIDINLKAKVPVKAFLDIMDPNFLKKNKSMILDKIVENIKTNELEKQLKDKMKDWYGIK